MEVDSLKKGAAMFVDGTSCPRARDLRVAHVIGRLSIGGAEKHFVSLLNSMSARRKWAIFISSTNGKGGLQDELDASISQQFIQIRKRSFLWGVLRLARLFRRERIDVVHTHMFWSSLYGTIAARLAGVPVVVTTEHGENRWKKPIHRWLERVVISAIAKRRFCVSPDILKQRRDADGVPHGSLTLISNGTPVPTALASPMSADEIIIGSVGRFVRQKNFGLFVDMIAELRRRGYPVKGCLVGDGPTAPSIRQAVERLGMAEHFELPGLVTPVERFFKRFDIYVVTSSEEGQPVSLLEAMSYGLPVVATNVGAISSMIKNGEEGFVVAPGNCVGLIECVSKLIDDRSFAVECGLRARARIEREFSIESVAKTYEQSYLKLIASVSSNGASASASCN